MNDGIKKIISVLLFVILLLGSGTGQIVHGIFHKHISYNSTQSSFVLTTEHNYCRAFQLMLPEFSQPPALIVSNKITSAVSIFLQPESFISHRFYVEPLGRAPPVLA